MATLAPEPAATTSTTAVGPWLRLLAWMTAVVAVVDVIFFGLIAAVVPPLAVGAVLTVVGLALVRRSRRASIVVLGLTTLVMLAGNAPFAVEHVAHPASAIDFTHAVIGTLGRALALVAAVGAWRQASPVGARRLGVGTVGLAALTVVVAGVAMVTSTGDEATAGDLEIAIEDAEFPTSIEVESGAALFIDNRDLFRHTFTVEGTDLDVDLAAAQGTRAVVDLPPGTYPVICDVPGHEFMEATLRVR